jgi:hypothetical protein
MTRYRIEQLLVVAFGFFVGTGLALCIAPGDVLLWLLAGIVLSIFSRAFFIRDFGGELLWPLPHRKKRIGAKPTSTPH